MSAVPNGEYSTAGHSLRVIAASIQDEILLRRIKEVLERSIKSGAPNKESILREMKNAGVPNAERIVEAAPTGVGLYNWVMMLLALIAIVLAAPAGLRDWHDAITELSHSYPELRGALD